MDRSRGRPWLVWVLATLIGGLALIAAIVGTSAAGVEEAGGAQRLRGGLLLGGAICLTLAMAALLGAFTLAWSERLRATAYQLLLYGGVMGAVVVGLVAAAALIG